MSNITKILGESCICAAIGGAGGALFSWATALSAPGLSALHGGLTFAIYKLATTIFEDKKSHLAYYGASSALAAGALHLLRLEVMTLKGATLLAGGSLFGTAIIIAGLYFGPKFIRDVIPGI